MDDAPPTSRDIPPSRDIIVIGASSGGLSALRTLVAALPEDLAASLFVVLHVGPYRSILPEILSRSGPLPAIHPTSFERIRQGRIYVAPPDHHLLVDRGFLRLSRGPRENRTRPAADPLFRSAARAYGPRVIGIVLSGMLNDGTAGLVDIKAQGGMAIVQDPHEAQYESMPRSALLHADIDYAIPVPEIAELVIRAAGRIPAPLMLPAALPTKEPAMSGEYSLKPPQLLICPECGGSLSEIDIGTLPYYRCHIGHSFAPADMEAAQFKEVERAQEITLRVMVERVALCRRLCQMAEETGDTLSSAQWEAAAAQAEARAEQMRDFLGQSWLRPAPDGDLPHQVEPREVELQANPPGPLEDGDD
jgi:two-component system chemotaxis response regulator CheB